MSKSGFMLRLMISEIELTIDDAFYGAIDAQKENNEEKVKEFEKLYEQNQRLLRLGMNMMEESLDDWDWKWAADGGHLCDRDWEWFGENLKKAGVSREEYDKKWKAT